jgi:uncharacterized surface protein with fasciclin (FAS1) repeats
MNIKSRILRIAVALVFAAAIAIQIPNRGGIAVAQDGYPGGGGGGRTLIQATVFGLVGFGIYSAVTGGGLGAPQGEIVLDPGGSSTPEVAPVTKGEPIWDVSNKTTDLKTFATAAETAGLKEALRKDGQYTAFIPTNTAFSALDPQVMQDLMLPENKSKLNDIIGYHVVEGAYTIEKLKTDVAAAGVDGLKLTTISGKTLVVTGGDGLKINGVPIVETDIPASNGVIHPIASVMLPSE